MRSFFRYLSHSLFPMRSSRSRLNATGRCATLLCLLSRAYLVPSVQALAADTIFGFDDQSSGTPISSQYQGSGIILDTVRGSGAGSFPIQPPRLTLIPRETFSTYQGISRSNFPAPISRAPLQTRITPRSASGSRDAISAGPKTGSTTLQAFNLSGTVVATSTAIAPPPGGGFVFPEADAPGSDIARFEVTCSNDLLFADDLTFDPLSNAPAPDFAVVASRVILLVGGSGMTSQSSFDASPGRPATSHIRLPICRQAFQSLALSPILCRDPTDPSPILTLTADNTASPVQDQLLTLTGCPPRLQGSSVHIHQAFL